VEKDCNLITDADRITMGQGRPAVAIQLPPIDDNAISRFEVFDLILRVAMDNRGVMTAHVRRVENQIVVLGATNGCRARPKGDLLARVGSFQNDQMRRCDRWLAPSRASGIELGIQVIGHEVRLS